MREHGAVPADPAMSRAGARLSGLSSVLPSDTNSGALAPAVSVAFVKLDVIRCGVAFVPFQPVLQLILILIKNCFRRPWAEGVRSASGDRSWPVRTWPRHCPPARRPSEYGNSSEYSGH